jgi:hypothetical protein
MVKFLAGGGRITCLEGKMYIDSGRVAASRYISDEF